MLLQEFLEQNAIARPAKTALICGDRRFSYAELEAMTNRLAHALRQQGVKRGDRVGIYLANSVEAVVSIFELYGPDSRKPGTFAANCLLARRLAERGVRFIQLYHQGWDQHGDLPKGIRNQTRETDQPSAALIKDLKQRGMLEDTLVMVR